MSDVDPLDSLLDEALAIETSPSKKRKRQDDTDWFTTAIPRRKPKPNPRMVPGDLVAGSLPTSDPFGSGTTDLECQSGHAEESSSLDWNGVRELASQGDFVPIPTHGSTKMMHSQMASAQMTCDTLQQRVGQGALPSEQIPNGTHPYLWRQSQNRFSNETLRSGSKFSAEQPILNNNVIEQILGSPSPEQTAPTETSPIKIPKHSVTQQLYAGRIPKSPVVKRATLDKQNNKRTAKDQQQAPLDRIPRRAGPKRAPCSIPKRVDEGVVSLERIPKRVAVEQISTDRTTDRQVAPKLTKCKIPKRGHRKLPSSEEKQRTCVIEKSTSSTTPAQNIAFEAQPLGTAVAGKTSSGTPPNQNSADKDLDRISKPTLTEDGIPKRSKRGGNALGRIPKLVSDEETPLGKIPKRADAKLARIPKRVTAELPTDATAEEEISLGRIPKREVVQDKHIDRIPQRVISGQLPIITTPDRGAAKKHQVATAEVMSPSKQISTGSLPNTQSSRGDQPCVQIPHTRIPKRVSVKQTPVDKLPDQVTAQHKPPTPPIDQRRLNMTEGLKMHTPPRNPSIKIRSGSQSMYTPPRNSAIKIRSGSQSSSQSPKTLGKARRMLEKHGWKEGEGLGLKGKGRAEPIQANLKVGRQGLGFAGAGQRLTPQKHIYKSVKTRIRITPNWLPPNPDSSPSESDVKLWKETRINLEPRVHRVGERWRDDFGNIEIQKELARVKSVFDDLDQNKFRLARNRANPFESLKKEIFQNRAALKLCEMDVIFNFLFSEPKTSRTYMSPATKRETRANHQMRFHPGNMDYEIIKFADICAGPGGFTEYFLHCHKWRATGFGFTLRNHEDFQVHKFNKNAPGKTFSQHYGSDESGDITVTANMQHFREVVLAATHDHLRKIKGVDVVVADGGFDVSHHFISQELFTQQLVLCQFTVALSILRKGGVFLCKLFDTFWPFTASLLYILYIHFDEFCIVKPNQSRPANSERYVICKGLKEFNPPIIDLLYNINDAMNKVQDSDEQVAPIFKLSEMKQEFSKYLRELNEDLAEKQIEHLKRIKLYMEDETLKSDDQAGFRKMCLEYWFMRRKKPRIFFDENYGRRYICRAEKMYNARNLSDLLKNASHGNDLFYVLMQEIQKSNDCMLNMSADWTKNGLMRRTPIEFWHCAMFKGKFRRVFLAADQDRVFEIERNEKFSVRELTNIQLKTIPMDTLLDCIRIKEDGAVVYRFIDAWVLGSQPIWKRPWGYRMEMCRLFHSQFATNSLKFVGPLPLMTQIEKLRELAPNIRNKIVMLLVRIRGLNEKGKPVWTGRPLKSRILDFSLAFSERTGYDFEYLDKQVWSLIRRPR